MINILIKFRGQTYGYDHVFGMETSQRSLYAQTAAQMLQHFLQGYNVTIIGYGQTGSGKTFTMGTSSDNIVSDLEGLVPRFLSDMFENLQSFCEEGSKLKNSKVLVSFMEIYGEDVFDLCSTVHSNSTTDRFPLPIREDETGRTFVQGLQELEAVSAAEAMDVLCSRSKNRITVSTAMNSGGIV